MQGRSHLAQGACVTAVAVAAGAVPADVPGVAVLAVGTSLAWSVLPDADHLSASPSRALGPVLGRAVSHVVRETSRAVVRSSGASRGKSGRHRYLTHSRPGALGCALAVGVAAWAGGWLAAAVLGLAIGVGAFCWFHRERVSSGWSLLWGAAAGLGVLAWLLERGWTGVAAVPALAASVLLYGIARSGAWLTFACAGLAAALVVATPAVSSWAPLFAAATYVGVWTHCRLGDACTIQGVPWAPFRRADRESGRGPWAQQWSLPEWMRFRTGGRRERVAVGFSVLVTAALCVGVVVLRTGVVAL